MKRVYFTPGPAELYFTVEDHLRAAVKGQIPSISHRSKAFSELYQQTTERLKALLGIPDDFAIFFTASATEIWERLIQNCVIGQSLHLVNGAFSERFYQIAKQLGANPVKFQSEPGTCVKVETIEADPSIELIAITHNETSTGTAQPLGDIEQLRKQFPEALITVDMVSSAPYIDLDFNQVDSAYFSVQKCFGLPAGLGVWLVNKRCLEKAKEKVAQGHSVGSYHSLPTYWESYQKFQTPETPNVLGIYLLNQVTQDMLQKGIEQIRKETEYKAGYLYYYLQQSSLFEPFVKEKRWQSKTVIVAECKQASDQLIKSLEEKKLVVGAGYGAARPQHLRLANFPTHSKEQMEFLVDQLTLLE